MATAVEGSYLMMSSPSPPLNRDVHSRLKIQNAYLAYNTVNNLLKDKNMNGLHLQQGSFFEIVSESGFKEAAATIEKATRYLVDNKEGEMEVLVGTLDITDSQLYTNFQRVANHLMAEDVRFGRISSLFFFTYVLSKRLHQAGRQKEIESVIDWLAVFLNEVISTWLIKNHRGEWAAIKNAIQTDCPPCQRPAQANKAGWMTMAAIGVGAFVVGALAIRFTSR